MNEDFHDSMMEYIILITAILLTVAVVFLARDGMSLLYANTGNIDSNLF